MKITKRERQSREIRFFPDRNNAVSINTKR